MHWADHTASLLVARDPKQVIAAGITPSGEFHIGHLREILTGEMIARSCSNLGSDSEFLFVVDSMDPLRTVYGFLSDDYEQYTGWPLHAVPAPDLNGRPDSGLGSYAAHFLQPFLHALAQIGVEPHLVWNHESYDAGRFESTIRHAIEKRSEIRRIIEQGSGRDLPEDWFPYSPIGTNGSLDGVTVTGWEDPFVLWRDASGNQGRADIRRAEGKLPWRIDWPARWGFLGITCEPFGKDHAAAGGSYDTGVPIAELLGHSAPHPVPYEWINLKGAGAMSSSAGNAVGPIEALELVPPEILRYLIARSKPGRHIEFDTGSALIEMADEYERNVDKVVNNSLDDPADGELSRRQRIAIEVERARIQLSQIDVHADPADSIAGVSFRHLALLAQIRSDDTDVWTSLTRSGHLVGTPGNVLRGRLDRMRAWIASKHFPEPFRLRPRNEPSETAMQLIAAEDRAFLLDLVTALRRCEWLDETINDHICVIAREHGLRLREAFVLLYWVVLDQDYGPRLASVLAEMGRDAVVDLIRLAAGSTD